ncbi:hypothetical protein FQA39_LY17181 [Lamprigera yunnana]|nr:hypothetical protein FQA39_LY17181 [Lamprigera yunnana]
MKAIAEKRAQNAAKKESNLKQTVVKKGQNQKLRQRIESSSSSFSSVEMSVPSTDDDQDIIDENILQIFPYNSCKGCRERGKVGVWLSDLDYSVDELGFWMGEGVLQVFCEGGVAKHAEMCDPSMSRRNLRNLHIEPGESVSVREYSSDEVDEPECSVENISRGESSAAPKEMKEQDDFTGIQMSQMNVTSKTVK